MITVKYYDMIDRKPRHTETKSGDEIVVDFVKRSGLELR